MTAFRARLVAGTVQCTAPDHPLIRLDPPGTFVLTVEHPAEQAVYYRVDHDAVHWADDPTELAAPAPPDAGVLLALIHGTVPDPAASPVPGVQRLAAGTVVRLDRDGVTVTRHSPVPAEAGLPLGIATGRAVPGDAAVAYSGGLSSAYVAVCALDAGLRPPLVYADFGARGNPPPQIPGLSLVRVTTDPADLVDRHQVTGAEPLPPTPDAEAARRLIAHLRTAVGGPLIAGSFLEDLVSVRLPEVPMGHRDWRLLTCEPFHASGRLRGLAEARALIDRGGAPPAGPPPQGPHEEPALASAGERPHDPPGAPPDVAEPDAGFLPGLTEAGREACASAQRGMLALWKSRLDLVHPALGRLEGGLAERGGGGAVLPALDPAVVAAAAALPAGRIGRIRRGVLENHLPLQRAVAGHGVTGLRRRPPGQWLRLVAAGYLHRERRKLADELRRDCALADLGVLDPHAVADLLDDGRQLAERALPLLRLVWTEQWLRSRS
jgi:hypothetical protein